MTHEELLKNQNEENWVRGCVGFRYLGEGLVKTVDTIVKNQHHDFVKDLKCSECDQCSLKTLLPSHVKVGNKCPKGRQKCFCVVNSKSRLQCPNSFCGLVYDRIVSDHLFSEPNWANTDLVKWGSNYLEIAKCFIGSAGYKDKQNIQDIDCSGLLNIVINNRAFENSVTIITASPSPISLFKKARDDRNSLFHSSNLELSEGRLKNITDNMLLLLKLPGIIDTEGKTRLSIERIQKIRHGNFSVSATEKNEIKMEYLKKELEYKQRKEELQTKLCEYYERCLSTIPVSPVLDKISGKVDHVFVELSVSTSFTDKQDTSNVEQVNLYKEILFKNDNLCKNVYLLGEAGMGKTTWCKKFLNTWMKACKSGPKSTEDDQESTCSLKETDDNEVDADICCLKQFGILFYIALRQESKHINIINMIKHHPVVAEYFMQPVVEDLLKNEPESCIILLDGLDEWERHTDAEIPSRAGLNGCTVVTTSRKYRLIGINEFEDSFCPDRFVEMTGIRDKEKLIKNVIERLHIVMKGEEKKEYDSSEEDSERFIADVKKMKDREISSQTTLPGYMNIPLMLITMVCLWLDKGEVVDTITKNIAGMIEFMFKYAEGFQQERFGKKRQKLERISEKLDELKRQWSQYADTLPNQLEQMDILVPYSGW